jgi:hypothetical protein
LRRVGYGFVKRILPTRLLRNYKPQEEQGPTQTMAQAHRNTSKAVRRAGMAPVSLNGERQDRDSPFAIVNDVQREVKQEDAYVASEPPPLADHRGSENRMYPILDEVEHFQDLINSDQR